MPGKVLLDTNIVIALFSGEKAISEHLAGAEVAVPSIVLGELYYGARKSGRTAQNLTRIDHFATSVSVVGCDAVAAQYYGRIKDRLRSKGSPIPENDIWIAAVAQQFGLPLASRDEHFNQVDDLILERW